MAPSSVRAAPPGGRPVQPAAPRRTTVRSPAAARPPSFGEALSAARKPAASPAPPQAVDYAPLINQAARRYGLDPALLAGLIQTESGFNPRALSPAGAKGLMQLMDATARSLGVTDSFDPVQNVFGGAKHLRQLLDQYGGDVRLALAAYNAGSGAVDRYGGIPPFAETQRYVPLVLAASAQFRRIG